MGLAHLRSFLRQHRTVALDTSVFVYHLEANEKYLSLSNQVFAWMEQPERQALTSTLTMTELLVKPYKNGDWRRADEMYGLLSTHPSLRWIAPDLAIADLAARLRAEYRLKTPDALQAATAIHAGATAFLTNDRDFEKLPMLQVCLLDEML